jgi:hypothetical protein
MAFPSDIQHEIDRQVQKLRDPSPTRPRTERAWAAEYIRKYGLKIERLALGDEPPDTLRARLDAAYDAHAPATPTDVALVELATVAQIELERLVQTRANLRADALRTAELAWQWRCDDEVTHYSRMFNTDPALALAHLKRSAAGLRHLIKRWTEISINLSNEGTAYAFDRVDLITLQGLSAVIEDLYFSEAAWETFRDCLVTQPNPAPRDIEMICAPDVVPRSIQERGVPLWRPDPEAARARLRAIVDRELPPLVALEARFRVEVEEPSRAAARDQALAKFERDNRHLLDSLRRQERSLIEAHRALARPRTGTGSPSQKTRTGVNTK